MKEKIENLIKNALKNLDMPARSAFSTADAGGEVKNIILEHPADLKMGDYSTNIAMTLGKKTKTSPKELAGKIIKTDSSNWWFREKSDWWVNGNRK